LIFKAGFIFIKNYTVKKIQFEFTSAEKATVNRDLSERNLCGCYVVFL